MSSNVTTWFGLLAGAGAAVAIIPGIPHWLQVTAAIAGAIGVAGTGVAARDNNKSSEDVGIKK